MNSNSSDMASSEKIKNMFPHTIFIHDGDKPKAILKEYARV